MKVAKILQKETNMNQWLKGLFYLTLLCFGVFSIVHICIGLGLFMDTLEHIHASWLIGEGFVPYRDFFEHHHPLLWYLFMPLTKIFYRNTIIIYVARVIAVLGYWAILFLTYKLTYKCTLKQSAAWFAVLFVLCFPQLWEDIQNLRPDIFMHISVLMALNYFLDYLNTHKTKNLCLSYVLWLVAFLFLQKAIMAIIGFAIANLLLLYKKQVKFKDMVYASIIPIFISLGILLALHQANALKDWYFYNFTFNLTVKKAYGAYTSGLSILPMLAALLFIAITRLYKNTSKSLVFLCILVISAISLVSFAPYAQYYFFYFIIASIMLAPYIDTFYQKHPFLVYGCFVCFLIISLTTFGQKTNKDKLDQDMQLMKYLIENTPEQDKVLNTIYPFYIFHKDTDFYWFGFNTAAIIANIYYDRPFDYNEQIKEYKPKFVLRNEMMDYLAFYNSEWLRNRNFELIQKASRGDRDALTRLSDIKVYYWDVDMDYVKQHYRYINSFNRTELWQRIDDESPAD